jgi:sugar lactone lactonase YvrE
MSVADVVVCSATAGLLSEGPRWHEEAGELLWVDILGGKFHRGSIATDGSLDLVTSVAIDRHVGAVAPAVGGGYVLAAGTGFLFVDAAGTVSELAQLQRHRLEPRRRHHVPGRQRDGPR